MSHAARDRIVIKGRAEYAALSRLASFLDRESPKLVRWLVRFWEDEQNAITYQELREALLRGEMSVNELQAWQQDYAVFFNTYLRDILLDSALSGGQDLLPAIASGVDVYAPMLAGIENWITAHGAEWVTQMSTEGKDAIATLIQYAANGNTDVDELSRLIRPLIGLTEPQAEANLHYFERVAEHLKQSLLDKNPNMSEAAAERQARKRARESALRYAARQHRERAHTIAQTELAFAYNKGALAAVKQAVDAGLLPRMKGKWSTSADERVCEICGGLEGVEINLGEEFDFKGRSLYAGQKETPPAHPRCRCAVAYIEAE